MANGTTDFEALARQYWGMWGDALRGATPQNAVPGMQGFREALDAWTGAATGGGQHGFEQVMAHFGRQSRDWYGSMQQVAAQFAGREHSAQQVVEAWKQALGAQGANAFLGLFESMEGAGLQGLGDWNDAAAPWLQGMRAEAATALGLPAFGFTREHQERLQALGKAQLDWQVALGAYNALLAKSSQDAFGRFEGKLADREEPGRQLGSVRALFDLWVDAAEEAYAQTALSLEYRRTYGDLVNAQMRLRAALQAIAEQAAGVLGLPGRTELDSAHRKIAELERQLRRMQRRAEDEAEAAPASKPAASQAKSPASKPAAKKVAKPARKIAKKSVAGTSPKKAAVKKTAAKKAAVKKTGKTAGRKR